MMEIIKYDALWKQKWDDFVDYSKNGCFLFKRDFMEYHSDRFDDFSLLVIKDNKIIAILPLNIRDSVVYSHQGLTYGGFIIGLDIKMTSVLEAFKCVLYFLNNNGIDKLILKNIPYIYHLYPSDEIEWALTCLKANLYRKDSTITIFNKGKLTFQDRRIRSIKKAEKLSPIIKYNESNGFDKFWNEVLEPNMFKKYNLRPVHSLSEINYLAKRFPNNIIQYNIYIEDDIMAGCTMFINQNVAHAQYISGTDKGRQNGCLDYLFNFLITKQYNSFRYFDFGICNVEDGTKINLGLMEWKEGFGGRAVSHDFYEINTKNFNLINNIYLNK